MLKILLFHADRERALFVESVIKATLLKAGCGSEVYTYHTADRAFQNLSADAFFYDILILDAEDEETPKLAQLVRTTNFQASILFMVRKLSDLSALLRHRPTAAITDAGDAKHILDCFKIAYREQLGIPSYFTVKTRNNMIKVRHGDILFFESNQRVVTLHTSKERRNYSFYAKLDEVYEKLPKHLYIKCHQSYVVNLPAVERLDKLTKRFILRSGQAVEISKRAYADTVEAFEAFCGILEQSENKQTLHYNARLLQPY
ncbi:MAG: LytTR family transcriptional regulator DNA-binding domain-containing protein [Oscillospiraceae bacterium]|nr:LytTR family transcriptional regulator DNA-binding domain-containing protein [Oscillospiraceae bacterium]